MNKYYWLTIEHWRLVDWQMNIVHMINNNWSIGIWRQIPKNKFYSSPSKIDRQNCADRPRQSNILRISARAQNFADRPRQSNIPRNSACAIHLSFDLAYLTIYSHGCVRKFSNINHKIYSEFHDLIRY
jgi:hypothetical protein